MAEERQSSPSILTTVAVLAIVSSLLWPHAPLRSARPSTAEANPHDQDVEARLWQDPFDATRAYESKSRKTCESDAQAHSLSNLVGQIGEQLSNNVIVLAVMETGRPYPDDHESRLRSRYAVVSAL